LFYSYFFAAASLPNGPNTAPNAAIAEAFATAVRLFLVFEFDDNNGIPGFQDHSNDTIIGAYDLSNPNLKWTITVNISTFQDPVTNVPFHVAVITATTLDNVFFLRFTVTEHPIFLNGFRLNPDLMKVDVGIRWYDAGHVAANWTTGPSSAALHPKSGVGILALTVAKFGIAAFSNQQTNGSSQVSFGSAGFSGVFSWSNNASTTVAGITISRGVFAHVEDTTSNGFLNAVWAAGFQLKIVFLSYEGIRPTFVFHDPEFGSNNNYASLDSSVATNVPTGPTVHSSGSSTVISIIYLLVCLIAVF